MFWEYNQVSSQITTLLANENVNLIDLLDQDDIVQECCADNKKLIEFLVRPNIVHELLQLTVEEPPENADLLSKYKYSSRASQVITSGIPQLNDAFVKDPTLLEKLYNFLKSKPPLNPLLASFFAKTIQVLLMQKSDWFTFQAICLQVIDFFKNCPDFVSRLVEHMGTSAIMNCLQYIAEVNVDRMEPFVLTWLDSEGLIEKLITVICGQYPYPVESSVDECETKLESLTIKSDEETPPKSEEDTEKAAENETNLSEDEKPAQPTIKPLNYPTQSARNHGRLVANSSANAAQLMSYFISSGRKSDSDGKRNESPLYVKCVSETTIKLLLNSMFEAPENVKKHAIANGIQVLLTLLDKSEGEYIVTQEENFRIAEIIMQWIPHFKDVLLNPPEQTIDAYNSFIEKPFGIARLHIAKLFVSLISTDNQQVCNSIRENQIFDILLNMFFEYKWNSFLHNYMENAIVEALNAPTQKKIYIAHLLKDCALLDRIIDAWKSNTGESDVKDNARCGYMGHLINIAYFLRPESPYLIYICDEEMDFTAWRTFYQECLEPVYKLQSTCPGGKPPEASITCQDIHKQQISQVEFESDYINEEGDPNFINDLPDNAEQIFEAVCENSSSSLGDCLNDSDSWTTAHIKKKEKLSNLQKLKDECKERLNSTKFSDSKNLENWEKCLNDSDSWTSVNIRNLIDDDSDDEDSPKVRDIDNEAVLGLARRLDGCENLDTWYSNLQNYFPQWSTYYGEPKPWGENTSAQDQAEWANFSNFDSAARSDAMATFDAFADFDKLKTENDILTTDTNPMWGSSSAEEASSANPESNIVNCILASISSPEKQETLETKTDDLKEETQSSIDSLKETVEENQKSDQTPSNDEEKCIETTKTDNELPSGKDSSNSPPVKDLSDLSSGKESSEQEFPVSKDEEKNVIGADSHR